MTKEEKQLLFKDLCARLPYGVICQFIWTYSNETTDGEDVIAKEDDSIRGVDIHTKELQADYYGEWVDLEHCKPYLRPMSSMTEEEKILMSSICLKHAYGDVERMVSEFSEFYNEHHLDYRGLIPMGLALEAPEGMYKED